MAGKDDPIKNLGAVGRGNAKEEEEVGASSEERKAAAATDGGRKAADVGSGDDGDDDDDEEWVEMPEDYLRWILAQTRETDPVPSLDDYSLRRRSDPQELAHLSHFIGRLQSMQDEFFEFQGWVRETLEKNGCVMVPASFAGPQDKLQEEIDQLWDKLMKEYDDAETTTSPQP